jgi:hypothetical protein
MTAMDPQQPGRQAGVPAVRAEATADPVYPYRLLVGYHDVAALPMTAAGLRSLRDALNDLLAAGAPVADDFVAAWARAHGVEVQVNPEAGDYGMAA